MTKHIFLRLIYEYRDPTENDDINEGYIEGQPWINKSTEEYWICVKNSAGAAEWKNCSIGVIRVEDITQENPGEYFNKIVYCETTNNVYYAREEDWILLSWEIFEVDTEDDLPILDNHLNIFKYTKAMAWTLDTELLYYCDGSHWHIVSLRYFTGIDNLPGNSAAKNIVHNLGVVPEYVAITPTGPLAGNIMISNINQVSFRISNDGPFKGSFYWFVIEKKDLGGTYSRILGDCQNLINPDVPSNDYGYEV